MNKTSIKVIKRSDAKVASNDKIQSSFEQEPAALLSVKEIENRSRREIVATISGWIVESRKKSRVEEIAATGKLFGNESFLSEIRPKRPEAKLFGIDAI